MHANIQRTTLYMLKYGVQMLLVMIWTELCILQAAAEWSLSKGLARNAVKLSQDEMMEFVWIPQLEIWVGKYEVTLGQFMQLSRRAAKRPIISPPGILGMVMS